MRSFSDLRILRFHRKPELPRDEKLNLPDGKPAPWLSGVVYPDFTVVEMRKTFPFVLSKTKPFLSGRADERLLQVRNSFSEAGKPDATNRKSPINPAGRRGRR
jgi:hypothetical protein